jgi:hypothetical protein
MRCLDMNRSEPAIVNGTREVVPGLIMTGQLKLSRVVYWDLSDKLGFSWQAWSCPSMMDPLEWDQRLVVSKNHVII